MLSFSKRQKGRVLVVQLEVEDNPAAEPIAAMIGLTLDEVGFQWDWINGELGCGEEVSRATEKRYKRQLQKHLESTAGGQDAEEYLKQVEDIKAKLATGELTTWPPRSM